MKNNIFLFYGNEDYLIDEEIKKIKEKAGVASSGSGLQTLSGADLELNTVVQAIQSTTLFDPQKVLIIDWQMLMNIFPEDEAKQEMVFRALEDCPDTITVIFKAGEKVEFRKKLAKWLKKNSIVREFKGYKPWEKDALKGWVLNKISGQDKKISSDALDLFIEMTGFNLRLLEQEIKKMNVYKGNDPQITKQDVRDLVSPGQMDSFELINLLRKKDQKKALILLQELKKEENPLVILGLVVSQFRLYLQIQQALQAGIELKTFAAQVGKNPFYIKQLAKDLSRSSFAEYKTLFYQLQDIDMSIKTGKKDAWVALEEFVLSV